MPEQLRPGCCGKTRIPQALLRLLHTEWTAIDACIDERIRADVLDVDVLARFTDPDERILADWTYQAAVCTQLYRDVGENANSRTKEAAT